MPALYRQFTTQTEIDAEYDVDRSVPDFAVYARHHGFEDPRSLLSPWRLQAANTPSR
jgi:arylformamidase